MYLHAYAHLPAVATSSVVAISSNTSSSSVLPDPGFNSDPNLDHNLVPDPDFESLPSKRHLVAVAPGQAVSPAHPSSKGKLRMRGSSSSTSTSTSTSTSSSSSGALRGERITREGSSRNPAHNRSRSRDADRGHHSADRGRKLGLGSGSGTGSGTGTGTKEADADGYVRGDDFVQGEYRRSRKGTQRTGEGFKSPSRGASVSIPFGSGEYSSY